MPPTRRRRGDSVAGVPSQSASYPESAQRQRSADHYTRSTNYPIRKKEHGYPTNPKFSTTPYSKHGSYAGTEVKDTYYTQGLGWMSANRQYMSRNPWANNGSSQMGEIGLMFKAVVPQDESFFQGNAWFWANGEAREYFPDENSLEDANFALSGQPSKIVYPLGHSNHYKSHNKSAVDRVFG